MGGKDDDDRGNDLEKRIEAQRAELMKVRDELLGSRDNFNKDIDRVGEGASSSSTKSPFERFKDFVDSNFSTLSEGVRNLPSNISELKSRMQQEREARREEEKEIWRKWTGSDDSPDFTRMQVDRSTAQEREVARDAVFSLLRQAYNKNKNVPAHKILELYRDSEWKFGGLDKFANPMLSFGGACYYKPETVDNLPSTARWGWPASAPQWLSIDWFKRSPYSPIRLETYPGLQEEGEKWRAAFEDLLSVALDKPMESEEKLGMRTPHGSPQSTYYGPGLEWMLSLQCRGILPPQLPSLYKPVSLFDGFDEVKRPRTAPFMHDVAQILESKSATMYPLVKSELEALVDEVSIKSGPETRAAHLRKAYGVAPWRVPDTEEELYDEMPPLVQDGQTGVKSPSVDEYYHKMEGLSGAIVRSDVDRAAELLNDYFAEYNRVGELVGDVLDGLSEAWMSQYHHWMREALRRSDVPEAEQEKVTDGLPSFGTYALFEDDYEEEEAEEGYNGIAEHVKRTHQLRSIDAKRPDVLSQLMRTQTIRLPDGTVTTKTVLKLRFADGTEEEQETFHTSREQPTTSDEKSSDEKDGKQERKKGGWFWS